MTMTLIGRTLLQSGIFGVGIDVHIAENSCKELCCLVMILMCLEDAAVLFIGTSACFFVNIYISFVSFSFLLAVRAHEVYYEPP